jgi:hypothetical protein
MVSIDARLGAIKRDPVEMLDPDRIMALCREHDYWPEGDGKLEPVTLVGLFMRQIAVGNVSCDQVRLMGGDAFTASGYCQSRTRLPLAVIRELARDGYREMAQELDEQPRHRWRGHRVLLMDATSFSMPDTPELQARFGQPGQQKAGCGFPIANVLLLFNARTGLAVDAITAPLRTHEMSLAAGTHRHMAAGDLVVGDDSFGSYAHLALLQQLGLHGLFPAHHLRIVDFTPGRYRAGQSGWRRQRPAALALGRIAGRTRPDRQVVQAGQQAPVDDPGAVEAVAADAQRARSAADGRAPRLPPGDTDDRDHAAGPQGLSA